MAIYDNTKRKLSEKEQKDLVKEIIDLKKKGVKTNAISAKLRLKEHVIMRILSEHEKSKNKSNIADIANAFSMTNKLNSLDSIKNAISKGISNSTGDNK